MGDGEFMAAKSQAAAEEADMGMREVSATEAGTRTREVKAMPDADEDLAPVATKALQDAKEAGRQPAVEHARAVPDAIGKSHPLAVEPAGSDGGLGSNYSSEIAEEETAAIPSVAIKPDTP